MKLANKVAIVTGAAGAGIGQSVIRALAKEGADVVVSDAHAQRPFSVAEDIRSSMGVKALGIQCDVSDREQVENMFKKTLDELGRIDILVNNAGINRMEPVVDMTDETWDLVMNVNLKGTFYCCRDALPSMIKQKSGRIINLSSVAAWIGGGNESHYCAAKAGISAFTKSLAREVGQHGITVNAIAPGVIWNEFLARIYPPEAAERMKSGAGVPVGRVGVPEDIAATVLFLVSDEASFITGETICVSGGSYMHQ